MATASHLRAVIDANFHCSTASTPTQSPPGYLQSPRRNLENVLLDIEMEQMSSGDYKTLHLDSTQWVRRFVGMVDS